MHDAWMHFLPPNQSVKLLATIVIIPAVLRKP